jgi:hypothetical protein
VSHPSGLAFNKEEKQLAQMENKPKILMATAYLRTRSGRSLLKEKNVVPGDPTPYLPSQETIKKAIVELERLGFTIEAQGVTLSISGPPELFEQAFGVKISYEERSLHEPGKARPIRHLLPTSSQPVMHAESLKDTVEGIVLATPGVPFSGI